MKYKRTWKDRIIFWSIVSTIFVLSAAYIILLSEGYKVNWQHMVVQKTGLLILKGSEKNVEIIIDGKKIKQNKLPLRLSYLLPGWHEISIGRDGYNSWRESMNVLQGQAYLQKNIVLFKKNQKPKIIDSLKFETQVREAVLPSDIYLSGSELWAGDKLISRFSSDISFYNWYPDHNHVIFQIENKIRVIDSDGTNDLVLVILSTDKPTKFKVIDSGRKLIYLDNNQLKELILKD